MPDRDVKTIHDVINYQYSKIVACSAFHCANGYEANFRKRLPDKKKFFDYIPALVEKKYLKTVYQCISRCTDFLNSSDIDGDGKLTVLDIDFVMKQCGKL